MLSIESSLHLTHNQINDELIPSIRMWDKKLAAYGIDRQLWFIFGSVVDKTTLEPAIDPLLSMLDAVGIRSRSRNFRPESDIDVGLVVSDGQGDIDLGTYRKNSPFRTASAAGHLLELTRFEHSWVLRRGTDIETLRNDSPVLGVYGRIVPIEL